MNWDNFHSAVILIGMFIIAALFPNDGRIIHLFAVVAAWTFGYYGFVLILPDRYSP